jgi:hypothetical protein
MFSWPSRQPRCRIRLRDDAAQPLLSISDQESGKPVALLTSTPLQLRMGIKTPRRGQEASMQGDGHLENPAIESGPADRVHPPNA